MNEVKSTAVLTQDLMNAQVGVLGCMLTDEDCVGKVLSRVSAKDFLEQQYRSIFQAIQHLFRAGFHPDPISVREKLGGNQWTELLAAIIDATPTAAYVDDYIHLLREASSLFQMQLLGAELQQAGDLDKARAILDRAMKLQVSRPGLQTMTFEQGFQAFCDRHGDTEPVEFLEWAILQLNEVLQAELGNVIIIGAYPGDGKTALALQCAARFGLKHNVGYFSFESKKERLYDRHVSREAILSSEKINAHKLTENDWEEVIALQKKITAPKVTLIDAVGMTALDIVAFSQANHFDVVFVDYLQQVEQPPGALMKDFDRVTAVSRELQKFAVRTGTAVVALSQLARPDKVKIKYKDGDGEQKVRSITPPPTASDLRSSGQIEQDADIILLMWREDYDLQDSPRVIQVAKNRNGRALDKVRCKFDGDHQTFSRIEPRREPPPQRKERQKPRQQSFWGDGSDWTEVANTNDIPFGESEDSKK